VETSQEHLQKIIAQAELTGSALHDEEERQRNIDRYNADAGGVVELMRQGAIEPAISPSGVIQAWFTQTEAREFLERARRGELVYVVFAAGRATRLKLSAELDSLGIAGLTPSILRAVSGSSGDDGREALESARAGVVSTKGDLSMIQRYLLQLRTQLGALVDAHGDAPEQLEETLEALQVLVIVNAENLETVSRQLKGIKLGGLRPDRVFLLKQQEEGGLRVAADGSLDWYEEEMWPRGHGEPLVAMTQDGASGFRVGSSEGVEALDGSLVAALTASGGRYAMFAQINDLHLLKDSLAVERWIVGARLIEERSAEMIAEVVDNKKLRQKGGAFFQQRGGFVMMRDTVALKAPSLEQYAIPTSISRMFYILSLEGLRRLATSALPVYLQQRRTRSGDVVLTSECFSGDATSFLPSLTIQSEGFALNTFKIRERIPETLAALEEQDAGLDVDLLA